MVEISKLAYSKKFNKLGTNRPLVLLCDVFVNIIMYHLYGLCNTSMFENAVPGFGCAICGRSVLL